MSLITEISLKKEEIKQKSSPLEVLFYNYLRNDNTLVDFGNKSLSNIEIIARTVFTKSNTNIDEIIAKEQKADNSFELHYCKNLIELSAMFLADPDFEEKNAKEFFKSSNLRDSFILSKVSQDVGKIENFEIDSSIDKLIELAFFKNEFSNFTNSVIEAIREADDLIDIFIIENCFEKLIDIHPVNQVNNKVKILFSAIEKYNDMYELRIKRRVFALILLLLIAFGGIISYILPQFWDSHNLEPVTVVIQIVFSLLIVGITLYFFLFHKIDDNKSILTNYINKRVEKINKRLKIDMNVIKELKGDFNNE
jgi:hypothetical protein